MKFIVDAQLPLDPADWIASRGHEAAHVYHLGSAEAPDGAIWKMALARGAVVLTKDRDFVEWAGSGGLRHRWSGSGSATSATHP